MCVLYNLYFFNQCYLNCCEFQNLKNSIVFYRQVKQGLYNPPLGLAVVLVLLPRVIIFECHSLLVGGISAATGYCDGACHAHVERLLSVNVSGFLRALWFVFFFFGRGGQGGSNDSQAKIFAVLKKNETCFSLYKLNKKLFWVFSCYKIFQDLTILFVK